MCALVALLGWSMYLVSKDKLGYASAFGSTGVGGLIVSKWKWQPFQKMTEATKLAEAADVMAVGLRVRLDTIQQIKSPAARSKAQWEAVHEYTKLLLDR